MAKLRSRAGNKKTRGAKTIRVWCKGDDKMKLTLTLIFVTLFGIYAEPQGKDYLPPKGGGGGGRGKHDDGPSEPANYSFSYEVQDSSSSLDFGHKEQRQNDHATGTYHVLLPDGRTQIVTYEAGPDGYHPMVKYEGTANQDGGNGGEGYNYNAASNHEEVRKPAPASLTATKS